MGIAMPLQELAEGSTRDTGLVGTVRPNLVFFLERGERLLQSDEADGTGNALSLGRPLTRSHHQAGSDPWVGRWYPVPTECATSCISEVELP